MEEIEEKRTCPNCKREIPSRNFVTHSIYCSRNIRICQVCKEPVPLNELQEHHDKLHLLVPCSKCGDMVRGMDMEDHVRDSCAYTMQSCKYCSLELRRRDVPAHDRYCGARTELCADCGAYVMIRYRQLHIDSNHGFVRLDEDSPPRTARRPVEDPFTTLQANGNGNSEGRPRRDPSDPPISSLFRPVVRQDPEAIRRRIIATFPSFYPEELGQDRPNNRMSDPDRDRQQRPVMPRITRGSCMPRYYKRTNDQPQINTTVTTQDKVKKNLSAGAGCDEGRTPVKKRPAPAPPAAPAADPRRDLPYYSALQRRHDEEKRREEQTAYNLSVGLPPVLDPAAKLEKLRKMDALHNHETDNNDYRNRLRGRVWQNNNDLASPGYTLGRGAKSWETTNGESSSRANQDEDEELERQRRELKDLTPMSAEEFMERFNELQLRKEPRQGASAGATRGATDNNDRYSEIRTSLQELRRGLNEVTAPYNNNNNNSSAPIDSNILNYNNETNDTNKFRDSGNGSLDTNNDTLDTNNVTFNTANDTFDTNNGSLNNSCETNDNSDENDQLDEARARTPLSDSDSEPEVFATCDYCNAKLRMRDWSRHEDMCAASIRPSRRLFERLILNACLGPPRPSRGPGISPPPEPRRSPSPGRVAPAGRVPLPGRAPTPIPDAVPIIPCEFCTEAMPYYLITEHQELCGRDATMLYPN